MFWENVGLLFCGEKENKHIIGRSRQQNTAVLLAAFNGGKGDGLREVSVWELDLSANTSRGW